MFLARPGNACLWVTGTSYEGNARTVSGLSPARLLRHYLDKDNHRTGLEVQTKLRDSTNYNARSDYAVSLIYLGQTEKAIEILQKLEQEQPGNYFIAANLGTAFELVGNNKGALTWIKEGIRRNSVSHEGTEWLHAKILEAKLAQEKDTDYFKKHSVLELDAKSVKKGLTIEERHLSPEQIASSIQYQLQERLQFVKPPDPAVASLLFDYAAIEAGTKTLESAKGLLQMAVEYGYPSTKVDAEMKLFNGKIAWRKTKQYLTYGFFALLGIGILVLLYERGIFVISAKDLPNRKHKL